MIALIARRETAIAIRFSSTFVLLRKSARVRGRSHPIAIRPALNDCNGRSDGNETEWNQEGRKAGRTAEEEEEEKEELQQQQQQQQQQQERRKRGKRPSITATRPTNLLCIREAKGWLSRRVVEPRLRNDAKRRGCLVVDPASACYPSAAAVPQQWAIVRQRHSTCLSLSLSLTSLLPLSLSRSS